LASGLARASALGGQKFADQQHRVNSYFQRVAAYWSDIYEDAGVQELVHQERLQVVLDLIDRVALPTTTTVLDIGCGAGNAAVALAMKGYGVKAMDSVPAMVEMTRRRALAAGLQNRVRTGLADVSALPFPDRAFGLATALGVLPWLPSMEKPLQEMCCVLRPGGYLIVTVDNRWAIRWFLEPMTNPLLQPLKKIARALMRLSTERANMIESHWTSIAKFDAMMRAAGLEKVESLTLGFGPTHVLQSRSAAILRRRAHPSSRARPRRPRFPGAPFRRIPVHRFGAEDVSSIDLQSAIARLGGPRSSGEDRRV